MRLLDPLYLKARGLLRLSAPRPIETARTLFGDVDDLAMLAEAVRCVPIAERPVVIDMTALASIGTESRLKRFAVECGEAALVCLVRAGILADALEAATGSQLAIIRVGSNGQLEGHSSRCSDIVASPLAAADLLAPGVSHGTLRAGLVDSELKAVLIDSVRKAPQAGPYIRLGDGTSANLWIDVKGLLRNPERALWIAYNTAYILADGFNAEVKEDAILVGNNSAYAIASLVQCFVPKLAVHILDRLGPTPHVSTLRCADRESVFQQRRFCILEDVISTGREVDLIALSTFHLNGTVTRVIAIYDLEVARSVLLRSDRINALCRPGAALGYKRLPAYAADDNHAGDQKN